MWVERVPGSAIRWYQIIPDVTTMYKNANHPWEPNPYQWIGLTQIKYHEEELTRFRGRWEIELFKKGIRRDKSAWATQYTSPFVNSPYYHPDVGSFWFQVELKMDEETLRSPGIERLDKKGLPPKVFRVSLRDGPGYLGYVTSFFNVPALFGSIPDQSNNYIGADCMDLLVAAHGKWTGTESTKNYNVSMVVSAHRKMAEFDLDGGKPTKSIRWGPTIRPGDLIAVRYSGARQYQHIGTLFSDANQNGVLDQEDLILHTGPMPLAYARLSDGPFDGHVAVLRLLQPIIERPIPFGTTRKQATRQYIAQHYGQEHPEIAITPRILVLHWTGTNSTEAALRTFERERLPPERTDIAQGGNLNVSAHFLIDKSGVIYRLMPETWMARHVIGLNLHAIGIENVGGAEDRDDLTEAQVRSNAWLVRHLKDHYPAIEYLIGHHEHLRFEPHELWLEKDPTYRTVKKDPGDRFMKGVRSMVADLGLKPAP